MHAVNYELVESNILYPCSFLQKDYEQPGRNDKNISDQNSNNSLFKSSLTPIWIPDIPKGKTDSKDSSNPSKKRSSLHKIEPRPNNLIIPILPIPNLLILSTSNIISNPINIQKNFLPRINNKHKSHK